ncbi:MAG: hypothetical protein RLY35_764 [Bacteroidota bacterium]|jgi:hypothetical protein
MKNLFLLFFGVLTFSLSAQVNVPDAFVQSKAYSLSYHPEKSSALEDIANLFPNGVTWSEATMSQVDLSHLFATIKPLDKFQNFRIGDSGYVVMVNNRQRIERMYQASINKKK